MFWTIVFAILFVKFGIPLILNVLGLFFLVIDVLTTDSTPVVPKALATEPERDGFAPLENSFAKNVAKATEKR